MNVGQNRPTTITYPIHTMKGSFSDDQKQADSYSLSSHVTVHDNLPGNGAPFNAWPWR